MKGAAVRLAALLALLTGSASAAAAVSLGDLVRRSIASGQPESGQLDGALGRFFMQQQGRPVTAQVRVIERLAGDCARFEAVLQLVGASSQLAAVEFDLCADGSAPSDR